MQTFTAWQYLLIDVANAFGLDKELFETRIAWGESNLKVLETLMDKADNKPLFMKAVMAIRKAQRNQPTGHLSSLDACCSGIQIMSALTGCIKGATNTGLVDPNVRADAYTTTTKVMQQTLGSNFNVSRADAKDALMTSYYGSKAKPKEIFGEDTPELDAFYKAMHEVAPGAWELLQDLLGSWQPYTLAHQWKLPDGFHARVKVMQKKEARIEVDELNHATFTYEFYENEGSKSGLSNVANVVHSVDAYVLRSMHRRCNYNLVEIQTAYRAVAEEVHVRLLNGTRKTGLINEKLSYYVAQFERSGMADVVIAPHLNKHTVPFLTLDHLQALESILFGMLQYAPFEVITIHDEFKCHPNNMNYLRQHYINIFAEIAESNLLSDLLSQIHGHPGKFNKLSNNLGDLIRGSNYALT